MSSTVSVVIPSLNSAGLIRQCLESLQRQTRPPFEIIVVDAYSSDSTRELAEGLATVVLADTGLTRARLLGLRRATGDYVLNLDSDQVLAVDAIQRAMSTGCPAVAFGESSSGTSIVARINALDKAAVNRAWRRNIDPLSGFIRPRFYQRNVLLRAMEKIPDHIIDIRPSPFSEDSLIFWLSGIHPNAVGFVPDSIAHAEEPRLFSYLRKWQTYGQTAKGYRGTPYEILAKTRGRRSVPGAWKLASAPGLLLRAVPFFVGYYL